MMIVMKVQIVVAVVVVVVVIILIVVIVLVITIAMIGLDPAALAPGRPLRHAAGGGRDHPGAQKKTL